MTSDHPQKNLTVRYQFTVKGEACAPMRDTWEAAANDAIAAGYARWLNAHELQLDSETRHAWIQRHHQKIETVPDTNEVEPGSDLLS
jgi:hypothetical protein